MTAYVLVHGGDRDGSIWDGVANLLRDHGHVVFCPTMTPIERTTLQHNIDEIGALILKYDLNNIVLVGHSYGAMVITGVLDHLFDRVACMVYIDSAVPENGKSLYAMLAEKGFNYKDYGLTPDPPCIEPLYFNENKMKEKPKVYIRCLESEFAKATFPFYKKIVNHAKAENWTYFNLDATHSCMISQPDKLAVILSEIQKNL